MGRSSRFFCVLCLLAATPALGQNGQAPMHMPNAGVRTPTMPAARPIIRANTGMGHVRPTLGSRPARPALGYVRPTLGIGAPPGPIIRSLRGRSSRAGRFADGGVEGAGLGLSLADDLAIPSGVSGGYDTPQVIPGLGTPAPCVKPQVIKIGSGVRRRVKTRVVYGPAICAP